MKIIGILLILGALVGGGIILSDTVPGYFRNKEYLARTQTELESVKAALEKASGPNATEAEINSAILRSESAVTSVRYAKEGVERRRNESLLFGAGTAVVLALGTVLLLRGRRKNATTSGASATPLPA